jgi:hypothetical protein
VTRDESLQIMQMIISAWPQAKELDKEEIDLYARAIQDLDAELTTHTVLKAQKETRYRPTVAELRERLRAEKRALAAELPPLDDPEGRPLPMWVRRWVCARMLYANWEKERDMRRFPEQGDYGDLTQEKMPEGAWQEEAESLGEMQINEAFRRMFKS